MADYLFDSSALVKRYVSEIGTAWVIGLFSPAGNRIHLARITAVEVVSAIARRRRSGTVTAAGAAAMLTNFFQDLGGTFRLLDITQALLARAMALAETHALRGYDAVQLAAALVVSADCAASGAAFTLVSADLALNAAATAEGLPVEDPNRHP